MIATPVAELAAAAVGLMARSIRTTREGEGATLLPFGLYVSENV